MQEPSRTIRLELDQGEGLLRGRVAEDDRADQEFEGWLGLLTVLGAVLDGNHDQQDRRSSPHE